MNFYLNHIINETLSLFNESIQYEYNVPDDTKKQFFDFYIWSYAYQNINSADFYVLGTSSAYDLDNIIREAIEKIVIVQKELLLEAGLKSIASELIYPLSGWKKVYGPEDLNLQYYNNYIKKEFKDYKKLYNISKESRSGKNIKDLLKNYKIDERVFVNTAQRIYILVNHPTEKESPQYYDFRSYGGKAWAKICNAWLELYNAQSINEIIKEIDDMYDMQHNTGFALNKDERFSGNWINQALDLKFSGNLWDLQSGSSIPERIVGFISKVNNLKPLDQNTRISIKVIFNYLIKMFNSFGYKAVYQENNQMKRIVLSSKKNVFVYEINILNYDIDYKNMKYRFSFWRKPRTIVKYLDVKMDDPMMYQKILDFFKRNVQGGSDTLIKKNNYFEL